MWRRILTIVTSVLASALLLTILFLLLDGEHAEARHTITATITDQDAGIHLLSPGYSQYADPGSVITYTHTLTNVSRITDTFNLKATNSHGWTVTLNSDSWPYGSVSLYLTVSGSATITFTASITIPSTTSANVTAITLITATSITTPSAVHDTVTDTTIIRNYVYLPLVKYNYPPPWRQANGTASTKFYDIAVCPTDPSLQYAGTGSGLYRSTDAGASWNHWALSGETTPVVVNPVKCGQVFAAVWGNGVYSVSGQSQAKAINQGLGELRLYGLAITANGQALYAGTDSAGLYRTNTSDIDWVAVNTGIADLRIRSLYLISDTLYAGSRQCIYYHSNNGGNSWSPESILSGGQGGVCGDAQVWAIAEMNGILYAGLGQSKGLYRRPAGGTWEPVPVSEVPAATICNFGLRPYGTRLYVGTYGYGVYTCTADRCQPFPNSGLGEPKIRGFAIAEVSGAYPRLLAGSDNGVWWVPLVP